MSSIETLYKSDLSRISRINFDDGKLVTPTFYPSISSYGTRFDVFSLVKFVKRFSIPKVLLSIYDLAKISQCNETIFSVVNEYSKKSVIFLDSGGYESYWRSDRDWTLSEYNEYVSLVDSQFYTSYDLYPFNQHHTFEEIYKKNVENILASNVEVKKSMFIPIFHSHKFYQLPKILNRFIIDYPDTLNSVAISERDCGDDIVTRSITIKKIRNILDNYNENILLHLLGCGNPVSLLLYSYYGVNSFDSLDWLKHYINRKNVLMYPFSYLNIHSCNCSVCEGVNEDYKLKVLLHNVLFYEQFFNMIQNKIKTETLEKYLYKYINKKFIELIKKK